MGAVRALKRAAPAEFGGRFSASGHRRAACCGANGFHVTRRASPLPSASGTACRSCWDACWPRAASRSTTCPSFLDPTVKALMPDPCTLRDMDKAAARARRCDRCASEPIAIFGDYDVDGACSAALLRRFLAQHGLDARIYIPDRMFEGYGPNPRRHRGARQGGRPADRHRRLRHHQPSSRWPRAGDARRRRHRRRPPPGRRAAARRRCAVVNPNRQDDLSGLGHLCAAGVTFLVLVATRARAAPARLLRRAARAEPDLLGLLDLVALATVADVVPLTGLNRAYVAQGPAGHAPAPQHRPQGADRRRRPRRGRRRPTTWASSSARASTPAAASAMPRSARACSPTDDEMEAARIAVLLDKLNRERKAHREAQMLEEALARAERMVAATPDVPLAAGRLATPGTRASWASSPAG